MQSANPLFSTLSRYSPGFSVEMRKNPWSSAVAARDEPVESETAVTLAPRRRAPLGSVTTPAMLPTGACALARLVASAVANSVAAAMTFMRQILHERTPGRDQTLTNDGVKPLASAVGI
jgi:hypothetical protein